MYQWVALTVGMIRVALKAGSKAINSDGMCKALEVTIDVSLMHKGMIIRSPSLVARISSSNPTGED